MRGLVQGAWRRGLGKFEASEASVGNGWLVGGWSLYALLGFLFFKLLADNAVASGGLLATPSGTLVRYLLAYFGKLNSVSHWIVVDSMSALP